MTASDCRVVELRRYALHPKARETLIQLFDRELIEPQEASGMQVLGQFRDLDDPDSFVWLRGFSDMPTRKRALEDFYGGSVWREHRTAANATMIAADNVLLLRPLVGLEVGDEVRPAPKRNGSRPGLLAVTIYPVADSASNEFAELFTSELEPLLRQADISVLATYATEHAPNTFPALPVREDVEVFVWMSLFADERDHARRSASLEESASWRDRVSQSLSGRPDGKEEVLRLTPTGRSLIHS